jgi:hypothetical protein
MTDDKWQKLQATIPWDVLHDTKAPAVTAVPAPSPTYAMPSNTMTPRQIAGAFVALLVLGVVLAFALGRVSNVVRDIPPALSLPRDTPAAPVNVAPAGPRRQYAPMPPTAEASGKAETLRLCQVSLVYYQTRQDFTCSGTCAAGTARCDAL